MNTLWYNRISFKQYAFISILVVLLFAVILFAMGHVLICKCGYVKFWHGITHSSENSQHIADWYTFSHIIHGFAFYGLLFLMGRRIPIGLRLVLAIGVEASWELFENSDFIINRYREATISLDYYGDSVLNSVADVLWMVVGFFAAYRFPVLLVLGATAGMELFVAYWIRDNLLLNIVMLIYPFEPILRWQAGG